jgi:SNF2 family DNA or RNA helicase
MFDTSEKVKMIAGNYKIPVTLHYKGKRIFLEFAYNAKLLEEIKSMEGAKWHGYDTTPLKMWSIENSARNQFQLQYLMGADPYKYYDKPWPEIKTKRPLLNHQVEMVRFVLAAQQCVIAGEMGTGKSLAAIEVMENAKLTSDEVWYVGPRAGVKAVTRELFKWTSSVIPGMMLTYEGLVKIIKNWRDGDVAPKMVIFDECSKLKNPTAQRSQAALHLANSVREEHGRDGYILLMSGTPAPKAPDDWWNQCEVACPGFLKEGTKAKFKARLCVIEQRQSITGGVYPHIVTWLDDENKCKKCGQFKHHPHHLSINMEQPNYHTFEKSVNEVAYLNKRMKGLVLVKLKKDCLDLPEKHYEEIKVTPTPEIMRAAKLIKEQATRAIQALTNIRELSDGFQYEETVTGFEDCPICAHTGKVTVKVPVNEIDLHGPNTAPVEYKDEVADCLECFGAGKRRLYNRSVVEAGSPKDVVFIDELDAHEDIGRYVVWGGFTGTIDRLVQMAQQQGWAVLRVDGRGYKGWSATGEDVDSDILLSCMDRSNPNYDTLFSQYPKVCFVGHPQAGGMALTLHASPTALFYSNSFDGEARMQAEDRIHRLGMDENRGCMIKDIIMLPVDKLVLENLKQKKQLQKLTLQELEING